MEGRKPLFQYRVVNNFNRPKCCVNAKRNYVCSVKLHTHTMTHLQKTLLAEIQDSERDGIGMGYSEFDGFGLTPQMKGVLGSLIAQGYVYNSVADWDEDPQYCSTIKAMR